MSPLRQLVRSYSDSAITKEEYLHVRTLLLNKLEKSGVISASDLENYLNLKHVSSKNSETTPYDFSDILIIILGVCAAATLAYILYS